MSGNWRRLAAMAFVLTLKPFGCGPSATQPQPTPLPTPGAATTRFPLGLFTTVSSPHALVEFKDGGTYIYTDTSYGEEVHGWIDVTGDQIVFKDDYCQDQFGTYTWTFDGKALNFKFLEDGCTGRAHAWLFPWKIKSP